MMPLSEATTTGAGVQSFNVNYTQCLRYRREGTGRGRGDNVKGRGQDNEMHKQSLLLLIFEMSGTISEKNTVPRAPVPQAMHSCFFWRGSVIWC